MDFGKPINRNEKPEHYEWEKPHLRDRIEEAKRAAQPKSTGDSHWKYGADIADVGMINRDFNKPIAPMTLREVWTKEIQFEFLVEINGPRIELRSFCFCPLCCYTEDR